jgi:diguanylate cyclase (GGDEF)-like protein
MFDMIVNEPLGIAIVDDDPLALATVGAIISAGSKFVVFKESDGDGLIALLERQSIDCIVLDYNLGEDNGFAVLQRANERFATVPPVVMLTGNGSESTVVKALRLGIDDYVLKRTMTSRELIGAIVRSVENDRKETAAKADFERLKAAAALDLVTGTLGRPQLDEDLAKLAALSRDVRRRHALIQVELVQLKEIRAKLGLKAGDRALREIAKRLQQAIRPNDICGRFGDDDFLIIANVEGDQNTLESLCKRIAKECAMRLDLDVGSVSIFVRMGGAICPSTQREKLVKPADLAEPARIALNRAVASGISYTLAPPEDYATSDEMTPESVGQVESGGSADQMRTGDRRREWRQRVFKRAQIVLPMNSTSINCIVRNLSPSGAGLRLEAVFAVPETFELAIFGAGERRKVCVRWQNGIDLGVEFIDKA